LLQKGVHLKEEKPKAPKVIHITKAKNRFLSFRPSTEPAWEVNAIWPKSVPEMDRAEIADADIRVDMRYGDPFSVVLRKARYVLENAQAAFNGPEARERAAINTINVIRDYGEIEGVELLKKALELFGDSAKVREAISLAVARIGGPDDFNIIIMGMKGDAGGKTDERSRETHMGALIEFVERHPGQSMKIASSLEESCGDAEVAADTMAALSKIRGGAK